MMKKICFTVVFTALFCLMTVVSASADGILVGEWGVGDFDSIVQTSVNDVFTDPGMELSKSYTESYDGILGTYNEATFDTWAVNYVSAYKVTAAGDELNLLLWFFHFNTDYVSTPFSVEIYAYLDGVLVDWATMYYDGGTHGASTHGSPLNNGENYSFVSHDISAVPEPASMLLLVCGLLGLTGLKRRFKK